MYETGPKDSFYLIKFWVRTIVSCGPQLVVIRSPGTRLDKNILGGFTIRRGS